MAPESPKPESLRRAALLVVFTLSGASGLIYEVLWTRRLTHIFGSTTLAVSTVLAAFMGGLAAGSVLLGAWADRNRSRALRAYGLLEITIAVLGLALPILLKAVEAIYLAAAPALENAPTAFFLVQFALVGAVLLLPCALMGGTLPVLARWLVGRQEEIGCRMGALYAANTLGAFAGTAVATYLLVPRAGIRESELVAVGLNVFAGVVAIGMAWTSTREGLGSPVSRLASEPEPADAGEAPRRGARLVLWATGFSGFACMVDEVAWARLVSLVFGSSVYAFGLMLLLFLGGMSIGSAIFARLKRSDPTRVLGVALIANALASLLGIAAIPHLARVYMRWFPAVRGSFPLQQALQILETAPLMLPPAVLFGIAFPAAVASIASVSGMGRGVGRVTAWNTAGTVAGAFLGGFVLIPRIGLRATLTAGAAAAAIGGFLALKRAGSASWTRGGLAAAGIALLAAALLPAWPKAERKSELLFYKDGIATTLSVDRMGPYLFNRSNGKTPRRSRGTWRTSSFSDTSRCSSIPTRRTSSCWAWGPGREERRKALELDPYNGQMLALPGD
jgi:spermidine synthase